MNDTSSTADQAPAEITEADVMAFLSRQLTILSNTTKAGYCALELHAQTEGAEVAFEWRSYTPGAYITCCKSVGEAIQKNMGKGDPAVRAQDLRDRASALLIEAASIEKEGTK